MKVVIVGNGPAGITAAKTIRERDAEIEIEVYSQETYPYYFRPKLPDLLGGSVKPNEIYAYAEAWYEKRNIKVHLGVDITQILPSEKAVVRATGERVAYDRLLLATGSHCFVPPIHGVEKEKVKLTDSGEAKCYKIGGMKPIDLDDIEKLERILKDEFRKSKKREEFHVEIRADHRVHFGYVLPVMDAAVRAGIPKMNITALLNVRGEEEPK